MPLMSEMDVEAELFADDIFKTVITNPDEQGHLFEYDWDRYTLLVDFLKKLFNIMPPLAEVEIAKPCEFCGKFHS